MDFDWVPVPVCGFKSQSELHSFSWKTLTVKPVNYKNVKKKLQKKKKKAKNKQTKPENFKNNRMKSLQSSKGD